MLAFLYALSIAVLLIYGLNLLWLAVARARREGLEQGPVPDPEMVAPVPALAPAVTVQLPLYNEAHVAERIIDACARLQYPRSKLEIQVLDDSTDETAALVAARVNVWQAHGLDIVHVRRTDREGYKAGALQNGLRLARGAFVAVFDADFLPPPEFLRRTLPAFREPHVGMVQARWGHANAGASLLTRLQAFGLDAHFALEQHTRQRTGCFINFNGTAGVWRRRCIEEAGGWQGDTLTEDLDLSYRAQLAGWRLRYLPAVEVPAEVPVEMNALRTQQFRWAKGAVETARKLLRPLWRAAQPLRVKLEGTLHLTAHLAFPFILLAALTHAPLLVITHLGYGPGPLYFTLLSLGLVGFAGFFLAQLFAQRALHPDWGRRLCLFPLFAAGTMGLALSNTHAVVEGLRGRRTAFARTPKYRAGEAWWRSAYAASGLPPVVWGEATLALYSMAGLGALVACGAWAALPFQAFFALVAATSIDQVHRVRASS